MKTTWTKWAQDRVLPFPGDAWTVKVALKKAEANINKAGGAAVPDVPKVADEVKRGVKLRLNETYDVKGNHPRDTFGRDLVDVWITRAGVPFALEVLIAICETPQLPSLASPHGPRTYRLRRDGQPWARLREHLHAIAKEERDEAHKLAAKARSAKSELRQALAYAFCDAAWVEADMPAALKKGYGQLALLAACANARQARDALQFLMRDVGEGGVPKYQLIEEGVTHMPNLMRMLDDKDAPLVVAAARRAWNGASRKPWLEVVGSLTTSEAKAFVKEHAK